MDFPRRNRPAAETREEHKFLADLGLSDTAIAARLGISRDTLKYALEARPA